jgi:hypothetical protein
MGVPDVVHELVATVRALEKLGARSISSREIEQLVRNAHVTIRNQRGAVWRTVISSPLRMIIFPQVKGV